MTEGQQRGQDPDEASVRDRYRQLIAEEMATAFGDSDPHELIASSEARLAHLRMVVRNTLRAMAEERWEAACDYLVDAFEREEHARQRQAGEKLEPFWLVKARRRQADPGDD